MRLIDADEIKREMSYGVMTQDGFGRGISFAKMCIDNMPTIDLTQHAQWLSKGDGSLYDVYFCSNCKKRALHVAFGISHCQELSKYCPHCGAKMCNAYD